MRILVPVDGSPDSMEAIRVAADCARDKIAIIYLLTVMSPIEYVDLELSPEEREYLKGALRERGEDILSKGKAILEKMKVSHVRTVLSFASSPKEEIINFAVRENINLIVMGSRGLGATARLFLGSVAAYVVTYGPCSVYVVRQTSSSSREDQ